MHSLEHMFVSLPSFFFYFVSLPQYFQNVCTNASTLLTQTRAMVQNILETVGAAVKVEKDG